MKPINGWASKKIALESVKSLALKGWIEQAPYQSSIPVMVYPDGKYLPHETPKNHTRENYALVRFETPNGPVEFEMPVEGIHIFHRFIRHEVRMDFLPLVRMIEANSSFNHPPQVPRYEPVLE